MILIHEPVIWIILRAEGRSAWVEADEGAAVLIGAVKVAPRQRHRGSKRLM